MAGKEAQRINAPGSLGLLSLSNEVNHVVGNTVIKLVRPAGAESLVMIVESGTFRARLGDHDAGGGALTAAAPGASVTDGTGSVQLTPGQPFAITAPNEITVCGTGAGDILTYWWI